MYLYCIYDYIILKYLCYYLLFYILLTTPALDKWLGHENRIFLTPFHPSVIVLNTRFSLTVITTCETLLYVQQDGTSTAAGVIGGGPSPQEN